MMYIFIYNIFIMGYRENIRNKVKVCSKDDIIIWARFWQLLITWFDRDKNWKHIITYKCDCWKEWTTCTYNITHWKISCWHDQYKNNAKLAYKHWLGWTWKHWGKDKFYTCYYNIIRRVKNPVWKSLSYKWIKCLWNSFEDFYNDMHPSYIEHIKKYWESNTTIDRINPDWNYCKENCRRATIKEQGYNKKNTVKAVINWELKNSWDIMKELWVSRNTAIKYLKSQEDYKDKI